MLSYLVRRCIWLVVVLLGILTITYTLVSFVPGDVAVFYAGPHASAQVISETRKELGLDQPKIIQYFRYLGQVLHGDLGQSATLDEPVSTAIWQKLPATLQLAATVIGVELLMAIVFGTLAAMEVHGPIDRAVAALSALGVSLPSFWIGIMLLYLVGFRLGWLPLGGFEDPRPLYLILPAATQGIPWGFWYARILRASLVETLQEDYVRTARSKGLVRRWIVVRHALPNAIPPVLTILAMDLGQLLGGIVVIETVFAWPGVGKQAYDGLQNLDLPLVIGTVLLSGLSIALLNILADLLRAAMDPRVRLA